MAHDPAEDLLRQWRNARNPAALGELLKAHRDRSYAVALRLTGSAADAEDAVQDALLKLMTRTHGMDDMDSFRCSLYRATVQCALDVARKARRRRGEESDVELIAVKQPDATEAAETRGLLNASVARLEEAERLPVTLCFYEGLSVVQAAATLEIPRETVRARLARALDKLRKDLRSHGKDMGAASLAAFMWNDGAVGAPQTLAATLDKALPGKACAQIAKSVRLKAFHPAALQAGWPLVAKAVAVVLVAGAALSPFVLNLAPNAERVSQTSPTSVEIFQPATVPEIEPKVDLKVHPHEHKQGEGAAMNKKLGAVALLGSAFLATASMAADPKPEVAAALEQIEARKAARNAVVSKQTQKAWSRQLREGEAYNPPVIVKQSAPGASSNPVNAGASSK
jgi:RNA polymerase sigma-70 factor (ECF subfamily)